MIMVLQANSIFYYKSKRIENCTMKKELIVFTYIFKLNYFLRPFIAETKLALKMHFLIN